MGKRGPAPGAKRKKATGTANAVGIWDGFKPPAKLTPAEGAEFHRLVANLRKVGTLDRTDPQLVVVAARVQALLDDAFAGIAKDGLMMTGGAGQSVAHPLVAVANSLTIRLRGLLSDLGLTPTGAKHGSTQPASDTPDGADGWGDLLTVTG